MQPQVWVGDSKPSKSKMVSVMNKYYFGKPYGGFWTSPLRNNKSPWIEWINKGSINSDDSSSWILIPNTDCKVYTVNSKKDIIQLNRIYVDGFKTIDYQSLFKSYDAIHVTKNGIKHPEFITWDCESVLWNNWKFNNCIKLEEYTN